MQIIFKWPLRSRFQTVLDIPTIRLLSKPYLQKDCTNLWTLLSKLRHDEILFKIGKPWPLFRLFSDFSIKWYNYYNNVKNVHLVSSSGIRTHDLFSFMLFSSYKSVSFSLCLSVFLFSILYKPTKIWGLFSSSKAGLFSKKGRQRLSRFPKADSQIRKAQI